MSTIFIGDLHGCARELDLLLREVRFHESRDRLFLTGDAFTKGPDPLGVWRRIVETGARMVLGNHDARLIELLRARQRGQGESDLSSSQRETLDRLAPAGDVLLAWIESLPLAIHDPAFLLVHAGINPEKGLAGTFRDEFLAIRTWPPTGTLDGLRWHDHLEPCDPVIIFGHDAPGGLVIRRRAETSRPYAVGLDTGCVYGGRLTAYVLEDDRTVQVDSLQGR